MAELDAFIDDPYIDRTRAGATGRPRLPRVAAIWIGRSGPVAVHAPERGAGGLIQNRDQSARSAYGATLSVLGISISGADASNYTFNASTTTTADITARALTVTATYE